ncbi:sensor histidine kinase [Tenacibaculum holothuriorum]|uniref:sensor histidine kinase n=1 Tax=Tenacibaculum holothuriorum TaxID=1635173 RepID=UPI001180E2CF|nr:sensor histidine kinase [Tenacibaculum holothuriorum]
METIKKYIQQPTISYLLFWVLFVMFTATASSWYYSSTREVIEVYTIRTIIQFLITSTVIFVFIPKFLNQGHKILFWIFSLALLTLGFITCTLIKVYYLEPTYPVTYQNYLKRFPEATLHDRLTSIKEFIRVANYLLQPTFLLLAIRFYRKQQALTKLNEQKKIAELTALKNQLNPHFLFNTLNNLYALAFKKSDRTMLVIQKLSEILDYTLYGCNEKYVPIRKEVDLIENYLALEKVRYDDRVSISFKKEVSKEGKIAPLLLLTFIENAFKHGVSQELTNATINIELTQKNKEIDFKIENTKPKPSGLSNTYKEEIGLKNVKKQLNLLYQNNHSLNINEEINWYKVHLKLSTK